MGTTLTNYLKITRGNAIRPRYYLKYFLTGFIIVLITPFRWYEKLVFNKKLRYTRVEKPVFILGHWRSGTTHLHNLMCEDPATGFVSTYQTVFPNYLASKWIFGTFMKYLMPEKRPSDNMKLSLEFPQEEEFGFLNTNPHSIYNLFYFPGKYQEYYDQAVHGEGLSGSELEKVRFDYKTLLAKAQITSGKKQLILKNPINTARINFLKELYPDARYIHIRRNPYTVFLSSKKFFISLLPTLWFQDVEEEEIVDMILNLYSNLYTDYFSVAEDFKVVELDFDDLEREPLHTLKNLYKDLGLNGFELAKPYFEIYLKSQKDYIKNSYLITQEEVSKINEKWGNLIEKWGYELPQNIKII